VTFTSADEIVVLPQLSIAAYLTEKHGAANRIAEAFARAGIDVVCARLLHR